MAALVALAAGVWLAGSGAASDGFAALAMPAGGLAKRAKSQKIRGVECQVANSAAVCLAVTVDA